MIVYPKRKLISSTEIDESIEAAVAVAQEPIRASTAIVGVTRLATTTEADAGTDTTIAVTPAGLDSAITDALDDVTQSQPARAVDTIYQNSTKIRIINVCILIAESSDINSYADVEVGAASPPTTTVATAGTVNGSAESTIQSMTVVILPSYYYRVENNNTNKVSLHSWTEWDLF